MSSAGQRTARFLLAGACDSYVLYVPYAPYVSSIGWKPSISLMCVCERASLSVLRCPYPTGPQQIAPAELWL